MSKSTIRTVFILGTVLCIGVFLGLSIDTIRQLPIRTNEANLTGEAVLGKIAWQKHDCTDCHTLLGNGAYYGPDLTKVTLRRGDVFVHSWLTTPAGQMPNRGLTADEVTHLVAFLNWVAQIDTNGWPPDPVFRAAASAADLAGQGASLFLQRGCAGCHGGEGQGTVTAPTLRGISAQRTEHDLEVWLENPQGVNPAALMPNLGLKDADVKALVAYLETLD